MQRRSESRVENRVWLGVLVCNGERRREMNDPSLWAIIPGGMGEKHPPSIPHQTLFWLSGRSRCCRVRTKAPLQTTRIFLQVDPRCMIQYLHWYHEPDYGEKRLLKTGRNANDPYMHTIDKVLTNKIMSFVWSPVNARSWHLQVMHHHFGRYVCVIANVVGESQCSAYLMMRDGAMTRSSHGVVWTILMSSIVILWSQTLSWKICARSPAPPLSRAQVFYGIVRSDAIPLLRGIARLCQMTLANVLIEWWEVFCPE